VRISHRIGSDPSVYETIVLRPAAGLSGVGMHDAFTPRQTTKDEGDREMVNRALFQTSRGPLPRETDVRNAEGADAIAFGAHADWAARPVRR